MRWQGPGPKGKYEGGTRNGARGNSWSSRATRLSNREKATLSGPGNAKAGRTERVSGGRDCELEVASLSCRGDLNPNRCWDRGKTFGRLESPGRIEVVGASMVVSASGRWAPRCVATRFFVRTSQVGGEICRVREMDGVRNIRTIGSHTETTQNNAEGRTEEGCESKREQGRSRSHSGPMLCLVRTEGVS